MTILGFKVIVTCLLLLVVYGDARSKPRCDSHAYGQPRPASCTRLILDAFPLESHISRFFSLQNIAKPKGITTVQYTRRVALPYFRENDGCKMAFLAIRFLNGSISYDTSAWEDIRSEAQRLKRSCGAFTAAPLGGNLVVGDHSRLAMILYASGSVYDDVVRAELAAGTVVVAEEDDEPELGVTTGTVKPNSLACGGAGLALDYAMSCHRTEDIVNVS